jgi:hypothetical protein
MSDSPNDLASPVASPAHTVTYDSADTQSDDEKFQHKQDEESQHSVEQERCPYKESPSSAVSHAEDDLQTQLQRLDKTQLVESFTALISEQQDLEQTVHRSRELLKQQQRIIENLKTQMDFANNTLRRIDALMEKMKAESESRASTRDSDYGSSNSDTASSKRRRH